MNLKSVKWGILAVVTVVAGAFVLLPAKTVNADDNLEIKIDQTVQVNFSGSKDRFVKYVATQDKMVNLSSEGIYYVEASVYKDNTEDSSLITDEYVEDRENFSLTWYFPKGTYYFKVSRSNNQTNGYTNVTLKDVTDTAVVVNVNETNFPDEAFRSYVDENIDLRHDGKLSRDEIKRVYKIKVSSSKYKVYDFKGIEYFTELAYFNCEYARMLTLDLSKNTNLINIDCENCFDMTEINVSGCLKLTYLNIAKSDVESINLSKNKRLYYFYAYSCGLKELDLSGTDVYTVYCYSNPLTSLKLKDCSILSYLDCHSTRLTSIDVSSCWNLDTLKCDRNSNLTSVKLNSAVRDLNCEDTKISALDLSECKEMRVLRCERTEITKLDISACPCLVYVYDEKYKVDDGEYKYKNGTYHLLFDSDKNVIKTMDDASDKVVALTSANFPDANFLDNLTYYDLDTDGWLSKLEILLIKDLYIFEESISDLTGIRYLTNLRTLDCSGNELTELNEIKYLPELIYLECGENKLAKLDVSGNSKLQGLYCSYSGIEKLDVSKNKALRVLMCSNNKLTSLDITNNTALVTLECYSGEPYEGGSPVCQLKSLDVSKNTKLTRLLISGNRINNLDISNNHLLERLEIVGCGIKEINIYNCPFLVDAYTKGKFSDEGVWGLFYSLRVDTRTYLLAIDRSIKMVAVKPPVSISLDKKEANIVCGATLTLKATLKNSTSAISWKSSNTKIATVDSKGKITAKMAGKVTISAAVEGKTAKCTVTVLYKDVTNNSDFWYAPTNYLTAKGVVKGYANQTEFRPANECTRAQMVTFLYRLQGEPKTKETTCKFGDVKSTDYFYKPVIWAVEQGITTGVSKTSFNPQGVCTRAQTVTFLWRMAGKPEPGKNAKKFTDVKAKDYFYKATLWASDMKILAGYDDGTFKPDGKCLRRQMVTFLYKYDKYVNGKG